MECCVVFQEILIFPPYCDDLPSHLFFVHVYVVNTGWKRVENAMHSDDLLHCCPSIVRSHLPSTQNKPVAQLQKSQSEEKSGYE